MTVEEMNNMCKEYFDKLTMKLGEAYEVMGSCNRDISAYLCPVGTTHEVTYHSKPELSFRVSDHWHWYANTRKCEDPNYIQCYRKDLPYAFPREREGRAGKPMMASSVCMFKNGGYHVIFGECYDRKTETWHWEDTEIDKVISEL